MPAPATTIVSSDVTRRRVYEVVRGGAIGETFVCAALAARTDAEQREIHDAIAELVASGNLYRGARGWLCVIMELRP